MHAYTFGAKTKAKYLPERNLPSRSRGEHPFKVTGIPTHHFIVGSRGSGKTLTLRFLERLFTAEAKLKFHYANCRQHNTSFKILTHLLGLPPRGLALGEVFDMFECQATEGTVVLLDELELMSPKDSGMEILYLECVLKPLTMVRREDR